MVCLRGYPIKQVNTNVITTDACALACVGSYKVRWRAAPFNATTIDAISNLNQNATNIDLVEQAANVLTNVAATL